MMESALVNLIDVLSHPKYTEDMKIEGGDDNG